MRRRTLLAGGVGLLTAGLAGCADTLAGADDPDPWPDQTPRYPDGRDVPADASTHHLFVENFDEETYPVVLAVARADDDALLVRGEYDAPDRRGFYVPDLLVEGRTYDLRLAVDGDDPAAFEQSIGDCPHDGGSKNTALQIENRTVSVEQDNCDEIRVGTLPNAEHETFRKET